MVSGHKNKKAISRKREAPQKRARKKAASSVKRVAKVKTTKESVSAGLKPVVLGYKPGIKNIAELKDQLTAAYGTGSAAVIDAGEVESVDTAVLQLLVAFANSLREKSGTIEWNEVSNVFRELADLADLSQCLGLSDESVAENNDSLCPVF